MAFPRIHVALAVAVINRVIRYESYAGRLKSIQCLSKYWPVGTLSIRRITRPPATVNGADGGHISRQMRVDKRIKNIALIRIDEAEICSDDQPFEGELLGPNEWTDNPRHEVGKSGIDHLVAERPDHIKILELREALGDPSFRVFIGGLFLGSQDALYVVTPGGPFLVGSVELAIVEQVEHHGHIDRVRQLEYPAHDREVLGVERRQIPLIPRCIEDVRLEHFFLVLIISPNIRRKNADEVCARVGYGMEFLAQAGLIERELRPIE